MVNESNTVKFVRLPSGSSDLNENVKFSAFGALSHENPQPSPYLKMYRSKIVECTYRRFLKNGFLCVQISHDKHGCKVSRNNKLKLDFETSVWFHLYLYFFQGDSGGPLVNEKHELVGVMNRGYYPNHDLHPDIYADVYYHLKFIIKAMGNHTTQHKFCNLL